MSRCSNCKHHNCPHDKPTRECVCGICEMQCQQEFTQEDQIKGVQP